MQNIIENIKTEFYERFLYPLYQLKYGLKFGYEVIRILNQLKKTQWLPRDELLSMQTNKLQTLIKHVYLNVPYYREIMRQMDLKPEDIKHIEDIRYFPITTKKNIIENPKLFISDDIDKRRFIKASTGGSTGKPLTIIRDQNSLITTEAALLRGLSWALYRVGYSYIDFMSPGWPTILGKIRGKILNKHYFPAFAQDDDLIDYFQKIIRLKPFSIRGYPSNLCRIAGILYERNLDVKFKVIFTTGEMLYDNQREFIKKIFKGEVYDYYGCNEVGSIAYECENHKKHISEERLFIEITNSNGELTNSQGEVTLTDLDNFAMPLIRYKNGDIATITEESCTCGRTLKLISISGRSDDFLKALNGDNIPPSVFPTYFRHLKGIQQFQIIQKDIQNIILKIVKNNFFSTIELEEMVKIIGGLTGNSVNIDIDICDQIPLTIRGKTRLVISHVPKVFM